MQSVFFFLALGALASAAPSQQQLGIPAGTLSAQRQSKGRLTFSLLLFVEAKLPQPSANTVLAKIGIAFGNVHYTCAPGQMGAPHLTVVDVKLEDFTKTKSTKDVENLARTAFLTNGRLGEDSLGTVLQAILKEGDLTSLFLENKPSDDVQIAGTTVAVDKSHSESLPWTKIAFDSSQTHFVEAYRLFTNGGLPQLECKGEAIINIAKPFSAAYYFYKGA
jgi:hypothetical protein